MLAAATASIGQVEAGRAGHQRAIGSSTQAVSEAPERLAEVTARGQPAAWMSSRAASLAGMRSRWYAADWKATETASEERAPPAMKAPRAKRGEALRIGGNVLSAGPSASGPSRAPRACPRRGASGRRGAADLQPRSRMPRPKTVSVGKTTASPAARAQAASSFERTGAIRRAIAHRLPSSQKRSRPTPVAPMRFRRGTRALQHFRKSCDDGPGNLGHAQTVHGGARDATGVARALTAGVQAGDVR